MRSIAIVAVIVALVACGYSFTQYQQTQSLQQQLWQAKNQLQASQSRLVAEVRPDLPVRVGFRKAIFGSGQVAVLQNLSNEELQVTLEVTSTANGLHYQQPLVIEPNRIREIGGHEGWEFATGQTVTLNNTQYRPLRVVVGG